MPPITFGICASFFFAVTFVLNRAMSLSGGSWLWSASLRYFLMLPFLLAIVIFRRNLKMLLVEMKANWSYWLLWSTVGFGFFYAPLCLAGDYGPGWLVAGTWQVTIVSGSLLAPLSKRTVTTSEGKHDVRGQIPGRALLFSSVILAGILLMQLEQAQHISTKEFMLGVLPILFASFAYPLGNRKMMELCADRLDPFQRVFGMTLASMPFWLAISVVGFKVHGLPGSGQLVQSLLVAVSSGVIATLLFFRATDSVKDDMAGMASVEATQSLEVVFAAIAEVLVLGGAFPSSLSWFGMLLILLGMGFHSRMSGHKMADTAKVVTGPGKI